MHAKFYICSALFATSVLAVACQSGDLGTASDGTDAATDSATTETDAAGDASTSVSDAAVSDASAADADTSDAVSDGSTADASASDAAPLATCSDGAKNGDETDVDCGGSCATKCAVASACVASVDCASGSVCTGNICSLPTSCKALLAEQPASPSGVYRLDTDGAGPLAPFDAYCDLVSDGGGWTLALKADGAQQTFAYSAPLWTNADLYQADHPDLDATEAKLATWNQVDFTAVRVVFDSAGAKSALVIPQASPSLATIFAGDGYLATGLGRDAWKGLVPHSSLQPSCSQEGFSSAVPGYASVRVGILGNQEDDCGTPDSFLGIGGTAPSCGALDAVTTGNVACYTPDNGDASLAAFAYVFVR